MLFSNNQTIAKNTVLLYLRMFFLMAISLYTYRIILKELGVDDYGLYNIIGGIITVFSFISTALVTSVQRFLNVALGERDENMFGKIYSMSINIFLLFSVMLLILGETVGLWFVSTQLNIPDGRETATMWVYQVSLATVIVNLFRITDNASIIAYEKMSFYAYISIGEAVLKLAICFLLIFADGDKLIAYVLLYLFSTLIINIFYKLYCNVKFKTCHYHFIWDSKLFKRLLSFTGWGFLGNGTNILVLQGENILLNRYFSVIINAARGTASQVYNAINLFLTNFQTAFRPQIIKTYAAGEMEEHYKLIYRSSKFSFYLMLLLVLPVSFNLEKILGLWLVEVPSYTTEFCIFTLYAYLLDSIGAPLLMSIFANGHIKNLQIAFCIVHLFRLLLAFIAFRYGTAPYIVAVFGLGAHFCMLLLHMFYARKYSRVSLRKFLRNVLLPAVKVCLLSLILPVLFYIFLSYENNWMSLLLCVIEVIWTLSIILLLGMTSAERNFIKDYVVSMFKHKR